MDDSTLLLQQNNAYEVILSKRNSALDSLSIHEDNNDLVVSIADQEDCPHETISTALRQLLF